MMENMQQGTTCGCIDKKYAPPSQGLKQDLMILSRSFANNKLKRKLFNNNLKAP
jgi:hypothetical protein